MGGRAGESVNTVLAGGVGGMLRQSAVAEHGRDVDDRAAAGGEDGGNLVFEPEKHAAQIGVERLVPALHRHVGKPPGAAVDSRIIDGEMQPAEFGDRSPDRRLDVLGIRDIAGDDEDLAAVGANRARGLLQRRRPAAEDRHRGAARCKFTGDRGTYAGAGAGDERRPPGKFRDSVHRLALGVCTLRYLLGDGLPSAGVLRPGDRLDDLLHVQCAAEAGARIAQALDGALQFMEGERHGITGERPELVIDSDMRCMSEIARYGDFLAHRRRRRGRV